MSTSREASTQGGVPSDWAWELKQRGELTTPRDTARGLFFTSMLESVRTLGNEAALARCQGVLEGQQLVPFFNYPIPLLLRLTATAAEELSGRYGGPEEAIRAMGRQATRDFLSSAMGNVVSLLAGRGIKQMLGSMQTVYRMTSSYGERRVEWLGPTRGRIVMRRCFMPLAYHEGVLLESMEYLGGRAVWVRGQRVAPLDSTFDFSWE
ncbi:DUF2378 family protein [Archangium violaceum]|uniref:DUF2378 family protein n=1 Tax=Archangium violaceum TaxID=83451 RepID=UPI0019513618|nr:DUF2378 family protein [Archangium violaceum]QRN95814.1 DUF2378 family protein [Archangium violaceum]